MKKSVLVLLTTILTTSFYCSGKTVPKIDVPTFNDIFCGYVKKPKASQTDIDYQAFRFSFIESEQFKIANKKSVEFDSLKKKEMYA